MKCKHCKIPSAQYRTDMKVGDYRYVCDECYEKYYIPKAGEASPGSLDPVVSTPITDAVRDKNACEHDSVKFCAMVDNARALEREAAFYRGLLQQICEDARKTRARRLAESGLMFWDSMKAEKSKRANEKS